MARLAHRNEDVALSLAARQRVIYADTDRMGIVYHGSYLRFMELARVEFMRNLGVVYAEMERRGYGLPVTDLAVSYLAPARYDDLVSMWVGLAKVTYARINFVYELAIEPGDRVTTAGPSESRTVLLHAETRHGSVRLEDGRATRMPDEVHTRLSALCRGRQRPREEND